jgi:hypothetical protein
MSPVRGQPRVTGQYALHFQCGWRLLSEEEELGGSAMQDGEADELFRASFDTSTASRVVAVFRDAAGVLRLEFDSRLVLEVLPGVEDNHSEDWRLLHLVTKSPTWCPMANASPWSSGLGRLEVVVQGVSRSRLNARS